MFLSIMIVVAMLGLVACDNVPTDTHTHTFATEWSKNDTEHWHAATCEHTDEVSDRAAHEFNVEVTRTATAEQAGEAVYTCKVCGFSKTEALPYEGHQHIIGWTATLGEHDQSYICCNQQIENPQHGAHTYNDQMICTVCGRYSVVDDAREKLNKGLFSYTLVVENINLPLSLISDSNPDITIDSGAFKLGLDENYMLTLVGTFSGTYGEYIEVGAGDDGKDKVTSQIGGTIVIDNNKLYLIGKNEGGAMKMEKYSDGSTGFSYVGLENAESYAVYDLNKQLAALGVENFVGTVNQLLEVAYEHSEEIKSVIDAILSVNTGSNFDKWFVKGEGNTYTLSFDAITNFNNAVKDLTVGGLLSQLTGKEDYKTFICGMVTAALNYKVGDMLDMLKQQGVDIYEINNKLNELIAKYNPGEETTIEGILSANGLPIPDGILLADFIDSKIVRAYKVIDVINIIGKARADENTTYKDLTVEAANEFVTTLITQYESQKIYDIVGNLVTMLLSSQGKEITVTGNNVYFFIDQVAKLLSDCIHVSVTIDNGKLVGVSLELSYKPATDADEPFQTTEGDGTTEEPTAEEQLNASIEETFSMARMIVGNITIKLGLGNSKVDVNVEEAIANINKGVATATPDNNSLKTILEGSGFENVEITDKDGRAYVTATKKVDGFFYNITKADNKGDWLLYEMNVKFGGYVDEMFAAVNYVDKCGKSFIAYTDATMKTLEVLYAKYMWKSTPTAYLTDDEVAAIRKEYQTAYEAEHAYQELFGDFDSVYKSSLWYKYDATNGFVACDKNCNIVMPMENILHNYELYEDNTALINGDYYTKLVYKCKTCEKYLIFYVLDMTVVKTDTQLAA